MTAFAYYNEIDKYAAQWLRNLMAAGHIALGYVDERSIEDVKPDDLREFRQHHFFAGIGVWSYALRRIGWPDDKSICSGSCPCQPFSAAGEGNGFADERHLWPAFQYIISILKFGIVVGEQVASKDANPWLDLVHTDLENLGYAFGAVAFPSAGVGAPHIRDRTYWIGMADANQPRLEGWPLLRERGDQFVTGAGGMANRLADAVRSGSLPRPYAGIHSSKEGPGSRHGELERLGAAGVERPGPTNGFWSAADWLGCTDGKWRPVEPGTFPLAHGAASRVGRLRAYGNAINAEAAIEFLRAALT